jgi:hypothetical protein
VARVPVYDGPQVATQALPGPNVTTAAPAGAFGATGARQAGELAQGLGRIAAGMQRAQDDANQSRVDDALNQLRETELDLTYGKDEGYTYLKGVQALQRPDGKPLSDEYLEKIKTRANDIESSLSNDKQKAAFRVRSNERLTQFRGNLMNYEGQENRNYEVSVAQGTIASAQREVAAFYNDPNRINEAIGSIQAAAVKDGRLRGLSAEQIDVNSRMLVSRAHLGAIEQAMATSNPLYAEQYLRTYKHQIEPDDLLKARGQVDELASVYIGNAKAGQVFGTYTATDNPTDLDRVAAITLQSESGGKRYGPDGQLLESPKGAKGEMQVLDKTNTTPGYGVKPARDDSPEERARVGRDYLNAMVREYDGNLAFAWAAYNAGPTKLNEARAAAIEEGNPSAWLDKLPVETQNYVAKNLRAYAEGGGKPTPPTLDQLQTQLLNDPDLLNRPGALKKAQEELNRRYSLYQKGQKETRDTAFATAMKHIEDGGRYDTIPLAVRNTVDPSKWDDLRRYEKTVLGGGRENSDLATYQLLAGNPDALRKMSDTEFYSMRQKLTEADFKKFSDMRGKAATSTNTPGALDLPMVNNVVDSRLQSIGLDPKAKSGAALARVGAIRKTINDDVLLRQEAAGRKFDDAEITKTVDELFLRTRGFKSRTWLEAFTLQDPQVRKATLFGATVSDIPKELAKSLEADFKAQGIDEPTDQQMLEAFFMGDIRRQ